MFINIRKWCEKDIDSLVLNANNKHLTEFLRDSFPSPYTTDCAKSFIEFSTQNSNSHNYAITLNDVAIGNISLDFYSDIKSHCAELGYWLGESYWNHGYTTHALQLLLNQYQNDPVLKKISAEVFETNISSIRVLEKSGFVQEGYFKKNVCKNGIYINTYLYSYLL